MRAEVFATIIVHCEVYLLNLNLPINLYGIAIHESMHQFSSHCMLRLWVAITVYICHLSCSTYCISSNTSCPQLVDTRDDAEHLFGASLIEQVGCINKRCKCSRSLIIITYYTGSVSVIVIVIYMYELNYLPQRQFLFCRRKSCVSEL